MSRIFFRILFLAALVAAPAGAAEFNDEQIADLARISSYLNTIQSAQGTFVQIGPDGSSDQGTFYLRKPGRVRFEYAEPNPNLIVSDGTTIAVENSDLRTTDRYPIAESPLQLLLSEEINLTTDPRISSVRRETGALSMTARQESAFAQGEITLVFADAGGNLELRQWEVVDAQGLRTLVAISNFRADANISARLFVIEELSPFGTRDY